MAKNKYAEWSLTLLRVVLGIIFTYHGFLKLFIAGGFTATIDFFTKIGLPAPKISALVVAVAEFFGGLLLLIGFITMWTSAVLILEMLVAFFAVHLKNGFLVQNGGYEFVLLILAALVVVLVNGAGEYSVGKKYFKNKHLL